MSFELIKNYVKSTHISMKTYTLLNVEYQFTVLWRGEVKTIHIAT
jgi:hypothetical protein